jgi:enamine deaminase RidA (YjgF/YER057c/UK114 family)
MTKLNPSTVHKPGAPYSHAVETTGNVRWLHCAGQVGVRPDGTIPETFEAQAEQAWSNVIAVLAAAGMDRDNLVKITHLLVRPSDVAAYRPVIAKFLGDARPASTMMILQALARPDYLIEVEAIAAK